MLKNASNLALALLVAGTSLVAGTASAAVDVTEITAAKADVTLIGIAVLSVFVGIAVYKWARQAVR